MRVKLQESFKVDKNNIKKLPLQENQTFIEKDGKSYKCRGAYEIPVWRLDEKNLNERTYPKQLGEKLINESPVTLGLANHPEEEADVKDTFAVEKNPHVKENILYVDAYLVGENGQLANEIIEAGGQIGLSSSAFGEVDDDGNVMVEDFELERFADWVSSPSYQVYASKENTLSPTKEEVEDTKEEIIKDNTIVNESDNTTKYAYINGKLLEKNVTNNKEDDIKKESIMADKEKKTSIEEKNLKLGVKNLFEKAESTEDLKEQRKQYEEILDYCDGVDFAEEYVTTANDKIKEIDEKLYELAEKGKGVDTLKETTEKEKTELEESIKEKDEKLKEIETKFDKAIEMLDEMKLREQKLNEMYKVVLAEKNGMVKASEYNELFQYNEKVEKELEEAKKEVSKLKRTSKRSERFPNRNRPRPVKEIQEDTVQEEKPDVEDTTDDYSDYENGPNFTSILEWYERKREVEPRIKEIKDEILSKRTLFEAQKAYLRLKDLIEDSPSPYKSNYTENPVKEEKKSTYSDLTIRKGWV